MNKYANCDILKWEFYSENFLRFLLYFPKRTVFKLIIILYIYIKIYFVMNSFFINECTVAIYFPRNSCNLYPLIKRK